VFPALEQKKLIMPGRENVQGENLQHGKTSQCKDQPLLINVISKSIDTSAVLVAAAK